MPTVALPLFADQPQNARRVADLGAGIALDGGMDAIAGLGEAVRRVGADPSYRAVAAMVAEDAGTLTPVSAAPAAVRELLAPAWRGLEGRARGSRASLPSWRHEMWHHLMSILMLQRVEEVTDANDDRPRR